MSLSTVLTKIAQRYIDKHVRAPRNLGFSIDEDIPDRGKRYGGAQTIHNTGTVDIVMDEGMVTEVWFRCRMLPFSVSEPKGYEQYGSNNFQGYELPDIVAIEFAEQ